MRLDIFLSEKYGTRSKAADAIKRGEVLYNGKTVKPSFVIGDNRLLTFVNEQSHISNGGYKLAKALEEFNVNISGKVFADIGASTGGFTGCLLSCGAKKVYAVDAGTNQLDSRIKEHPSVVDMQQTNARYLERDSFDLPLDGAVIDVSFISVKLIIPVLKELVQQGGDIIVLVKPQFECGKKLLNKNGIVTDKGARHGAVKDIIDFCGGLGLAVEGVTNAPVKPGKNIEYLIHIKKGGGNNIGGGAVDSLP